MNPHVVRWAPAVIFGAGLLLLLSARRQAEMALTTPLDQVVADTVGPFEATRVFLTDAEREVAGVTEYLALDYRRDDSTAATASAPWFSVYIGYYDSQVGGRTIHSPRNCLPGGGWEPLTNRREVLRGPWGDAPINRYLIQNDRQLALVLYWYQGRGRVEANEYVVKFDLLKDGALRGRTEEALVRVVVPITEAGEEAAWALGRSVAEQLMRDVGRALPT